MQRSLLQPQTHEDIRALLVQSFVPHIAVHACADTERLAHDKGFIDGFWEMLRPYSERVHGKVTIRDSVGASRGWDDFGVRFFKLENSVAAVSHRSTRNAELRFKAANGAPPEGRSLRHVGPAARRTGGDIVEIEDLVERHLSRAESTVDGSDHMSPVHNGALHTSSHSVSPFYSLFLRRLLSGQPLSPHETFSHPVACIIAISSRTPSPIEALRQLYNSTKTGDVQLPEWVNSEYLRYYVLVHDEDVDDISKSTALFEQMKRHFGLHCHMLRLRSSQCVPTDDDSIRIPRSDWISAAEELARMITEEDNDDDDSGTPRCLYESDVTALKTFIREMVTQSVVPFMERLVVTWNDQVASRRRGISGRFVSLSKRFTAFGSSRSSSAAGSGSSSAGSNTNYDTLQGFYNPEAPEAVMRKLGDFAFMLRDWKLAQSIYEIVRSDYNDDKAWKYYAGANEMTAISALLAQPVLNTKTRSETVDQMLDFASYSYINRCAAPYYALRCLATGAELLRIRGGPAADEAARWHARVLEMNLLGPVGRALFTQQVATCYASRRGAGSKAWGSRPRKSALWNVLAASAWLALKKPAQARLCLNQASGVYGRSSHEDGLPGFDGIEDFVGEIVRHLDAYSAASQAIHGLADGHQALPDVVETESEQLDLRSHRASLMGPNVSPFTGGDAGLLSSGQTLRPNEAVREDGFEPS